MAIKQVPSPNFYTIGIEHEGDEQTEWTDATYTASSSLIRDISTRWNIPLDRNQAPVTTVDAGARLGFDGFTEQGEVVSGNSKWYYNIADGTWFWSGGVQ